MSEGYIFVNKEFPDDAWDPVWRDLVNHPVAHLKQDWVGGISIPDPPAGCCIEIECRAVLAAKNEREQRLNDIDVQSGSLEAMLLPMEKLMQTVRKPLMSGRPATRLMIDAALTDLTSGLFTLKARFKRGRPYHCCDLQLEPLYMRPHPRYPGHPSYPSGHSAEAHTCALLYSEIFPQLREELLGAAYSVARNREVAGLHFGSDTEGGRNLACAFVPLLLAVPSFDKLLAAARKEWL